MRKIKGTDIRWCLLPTLDVG